MVTDAALARLAVQADALRAAAAFVEDAAMDGLTVIVYGDGQIRILIEEQSGPAGSRVHAVAAAAGAAGASTPAWSALTRSLHSRGELAGHLISIATFVAGNDPEGEPS
jgi:hypothetical protein